MPAIPLQYFGYHPYNNPTHSERNVELPLAFWFLEKFHGDLAHVIEVGEVTPFYQPPAHAVFDPGAEQPGTIRCDAAEVDYRGKHLLSISTIEHIGTSEYGQTPDPALLPRVLEKMLASRTYFITFALGFNPQLDELVKDHRCLILERIAPTRWQQTDRPELGKYQYHSPWYAGNGVCVLTNLEDLHFEFARRSPCRVATRWRAHQWSWKNFARGTRQELADQWRAGRKPSLSL